MGQHLSYFYQHQWALEGSTWRPSTSPPTPDIITLRDEAGTIITSSSMTSMLMTVYDRSGGEKAIINGVERVEVKNTRSCTLNSLGIFTLVLLPTDMVILDSARTYEQRTALIEYTWASGAKADALEIDFIVKNVGRRWTPLISTMRVMDTAYVTLT